MGSLRAQEPKRRFRGVKSAVIKIHKDLFTIEHFVKRYTAYYPTSLTELEKLTIVLEDRRFFDHRGVDAKSTLREIWRALTFRRHGGASTIDMQFVRTVTGYRQKTIRRKLYEMFLVYLIQFRYSKVVILRSYLACAFFGSHLFGADRAARKLYGRSADTLGTEEAAVLAAMLVYPRPTSPTPAWELKVQRRAHYGVRIYVANKERFDKLPG
jgi:membrane peptidoglycan carboxypeptidase